MVELVEELRKFHQTPAVEEIIREALAGEYHDYKNQKYACGKVEVHRRLMALNHAPARALAKRVANGEFDEEADESDMAELRKTAPKELWSVLGLDRNFQ
jgi:hypothetical protein